MRSSPIPAGRPTPRAAHALVVALALLVVVALGGLVFTVIAVLTIRTLGGDEARVLQQLWRRVKRSKSANP